jgi:D-xylonolactonase
MQIRAVAQYRCNTGEIPTWHPGENVVYWADIPAGRLFRYDPATEAHAEVFRTSCIGLITLQADGALLLGLDKGRMILWKDGREQRVVCEGIDGETRYNDGIADPHGRVYTGTMPKPQRDGKPLPGQLYRFDLDGSYRIVDEGFMCANGMGFTPDGRHLYFTDSPTGRIYRYQYDARTGDLSKREVFYEAPGTIPDGMTVDAEGFLWSAQWDGYGVLCIDPSTAKVVRKIEVPTAAKCSAIAFAGNDLDTAYITTAGGNAPEKNGSDAGALFRVECLGVRGVPEFRSRILL